LVEYIESIEVANIIQICIDNVLNMQSGDDLSNPFFSKFLLSKLCYLLFGFTTKWLGGKNMGKTNFAHEIVVFNGQLCEGQ
jgi:hypothetical protein